MRIYIESTIPSYIVARPARDLFQAARQQLTRDWWDSRRGDHELFVSQIVFDEIGAGDPELAEKRVRLIDGITLLDAMIEAETLAEAILSSKLLPPGADRDAAHISLASVHRMDLLLTWNCRHIANPAIQARLRRLVEARGWTLPELCTPDTLLGMRTYE